MAEIDRRLAAMDYVFGSAGRLSAPIEWLPSHFSYAILVFA